MNKHAELLELKVELTNSDVAITLELFFAAPLPPLLTHHRIQSESGEKCFNRNYVNFFASLRSQRQKGNLKNPHNQYHTCRQRMETAGS
jgi:hypothetical protein